jgi:hypothetical protein
MTGWATRPAEPAGHAPTADEVDTILDQIEGLWVAWTPTLTNLTQGNGAVLARYVQAGSTVHYRFRFTLGSTSAVGTGPEFTLPVAPGDYAGPTPLGSAVYTDAGTTNRWGYAQLNSGSTVDLIGFSTTGTSVGLTATVPHVWAVNDVIAVVGSYEPA